MNQSLKTDGEDDLDGAPDRVSRIKLFLLFSVFALLGGGLLVARRTGLSLSIQDVLAGLHGDRAWQGWIVCEVIQILVALCGILPASATAMGIGAAYGIVDGFLLAAPATMIGALLSFVLARSFLRGFINRLLRKKTWLDRLDHVLSAEGWKIACLFRLSPIMPFSLTSYALGMSALSLRDYMIGTLASLPALLGYIAMGALTARSLTSVSGESASWIHAAILIVGAAATFALVWHLNRVISRILSTDRTTA
ncbi:TVP38/TMEM64 family protein [Komagataeibacter sp. AV436]|uniref:TVP38/TMEM64 family membrane protein n=1 Tax=Komagataeibacter melomenusus TaxID=2766578 RepID=A0ABX2AHG6_9PROT|nr:VTT domain-containing protein [Komagataeibacter melomenusus]MBV1829596.1 VTT domain-containing protein [Komagataeibacter melomenusus]NPC67726.1 TVP38/TMEM64 family protein [Komagataeibacter melomenusus]